MSTIHGTAFLEMGWRENPTLEGVGKEIATMP